MTPPTPYVYVVYVFRTGEDGAGDDMLLLGVYATEFAARAAARNETPMEDETVIVSCFPVLDGPKTDDSPEPHIVYRRRYEGPQS